MSSEPPDQDPSSVEGEQQPAGRGGDSGGGVRRALRAVGPGIVTGAADDDPSGIATYAQSGALYGTGLLWTVPLTLPLMIVVQEACERMTLATGDSFGALIRRRFERGARTWITVLLAALLVANSVNAAADLVAIGESMSLLHAGPAPLWSLIAGVVVGFVVVRGSFAWISRVFTWLCLVLFAYVGVVIGMLFSVAIMFAIIVSAAATLGVHHQKVDSAEAAARALQPIAGDFAFALFAIGFIGSGMLAVPVLAASGSAGFAALLGRPWSLDRKPHQARTFYALLLVSLTIAVVLSVIGVDPIGLLVMSAIINGIAAGPFLIVLMLITGNRELMGEHRNGPVARILGWGTAVIMCAAGAFGIVSLALGQ